MIPISEPDISEREIEYVKDAVSSGWVSSHGKYIEEFESKFIAYIGTSRGLTCSNGTSALHLALSALGIGKGDEVIVPDLTFISPVNAVLYNNAVPVLCDVNRENWSIDPDEVEEKITRRTKAIIAVHLYGNSANMDRLVKISEQYGLYLIEDTAESLGTTYRGKKLGSFGDIGCFSFYGNKTITTGEGGFCTTNQDELSERMLLLRDHGMRQDKRYWHDFIGYNYRMTNLQAALGVAQLERIKHFITKKRVIAEHYEKRLKGSITTHPIGKNYKGTFWLYSILVDNFHLREALIKYLQKNEIEVRRFFYPAHSMPIYERFSKGKYLVAQDISERGINLPSGVKLTIEQIDYISDKIVDFLNHRRNEAKEV